MNETMTGKCGISGGNLPKDFKVNYVLNIVNDLTREQELEEIFASLRIKHQKCRDTVTVLTLKDREKEGSFTVKASELLEKKVRVQMTPEQAVEAVIASGDQAKIDALIKQLQNGRTKK